MNPYIITEATQPKVPILLSVPHCGTAFPDEIAGNYNPEMMAAPDDTDWYVDKLYNFASEMGITMISARYSRWVIDLNRNPESKPLYNDGRIITALCPATDFHGKSIYSQSEPDEQEVQRRVKAYYEPYHNKIQMLLNNLKAEFGKVLLWDAHSIRHYVPTIQKDIFPDMILGSADETSAAPQLILTALGSLRSSSYQINHNHPFKGGQITRSFGKPSENQHALQLEMNKILYMDDSETAFNELRANKVRDILKPAFELLIKTLESI